MKIFTRTDFIQVWKFSDDVTFVQDLASLYKMYVKEETLNDHYLIRKWAYNLKFGILTKFYQGNPIIESICENFHFSPLYDVIDNPRNQKNGQKDQTALSSDRNKW